MYCIQCGTQNPDQAMFCRNCGRSLSIEEKPTGPVAIFTSSAQGSAHYTPIPSEQYWPGTPHELAVEDAPTAIPQTPLAEQYFTPPIDAIHPAAENFFAPAMDSTSAPTYATYPPPHPSRFHRLANPLPTVFLALAIVVVAAIFVVLFFTGTDWAAGATHVAIGAAITALLVVTTAAVRSFAGMASRANPKRMSQFISAGVAILLLTLISLAGFTQQSTIHSLQAHALEGQQQWQRAIDEYQMAGERVPVSDNIARVNNEWGEQFAGQQRYQEAFVKFDTVLNAFGSPAAEVNRAQTDEINAYLGWAKQAMDTKAYNDATQRYDELLQKPYCQARCQTQVNRFDATAYYNLAESQLGTQDYTDAVSNFGTVLSRFPDSPEATKLHGDYAQSLYGQGQQQLASACSTAIPTYQKLASQFADTTQGQQAAAALKAPQPVKGRFTGVVPNKPSLSDIAALMKGITSSTTSNQFYPVFNSGSTPKATIHSDGSFAFQPVPQGTYDLVWGTNNTADGNQYYFFRYQGTDGSPIYVANVGPLCAFDFGDIHEDVPTAP
jgi:tetratricopeptide (TPR) repeat protein